MTEEEIRALFPTATEEEIQIAINFADPEPYSLEEALVDCVLWENGEIDNLKFAAFIDVQLIRIKDDVVEVSNGYSAPIEFCKYIDSIRNTPTEESHDVAGFTINWVRDGTVSIDNCIFLTKDVMDKLKTKHPEHFGE